MTRPQPSCPVQIADLYLRDLLENQLNLHPRRRRLLESVLASVGDIASGRAGKSHLLVLEGLIRELSLPPSAAPDAEAGLVEKMSAFFDTNRESFESHVETGNCPSGDCGRLTPSPCQMACPAGVDVPSYISLIGQGRYAEAVALIRKDNPLPWVCGLVCTHPCEANCVRGRVDKPVSIKALKAFAAERVFSAEQYKPPQPAGMKGVKVCVVGAGPGGLSAAYYLALAGYRVTVIEALPRAGGMLLVGIPRYRLPAEVIQKETALIESLGVEFRFNTRFGRDTSLARLKAEGFKALFLAVGAHASMEPELAGAGDFSGVRNAVDLLREVALGLRRPPGERAAVIGGGNVAIDAARTCLRLGCRAVTVVYRRTREDMPAALEEIEQAEEEGVRFEFQSIPIAVQGRAGIMEGLHCRRARMVSVPGARRKSPQPIEDSDFTIPADTVISAIGQRVDRRWLEELSGLAWTSRGAIQIKPATMETSLPGVFAAGDAVTGPATVIEAIGGGKRAARAIDRYLQGLPQSTLAPVPVRRERLDCTKIPAAIKMTLQRPEMPLLDDELRRTTFQQVELGLNEKEAREEALRCLRCDICRRCGRCVEVCRDQMGVNALSMAYLDCESSAVTDFQRTAQLCIGCGACAANCPNGAMVIEDRGEERILSLCGTILSRQPLVRCTECGAAIGTPRYLDFVRNRLAGMPPATDALRLCPACARRKWSREGPARKDADREAEREFWALRPDKREQVRSCEESDKELR